MVSEELLVVVDVVVEVEVVVFLVSRSLLATGEGELLESALVWPVIAWLKTESPHTIYVNKSKCCQFSYL